MSGPTQTRSMELAERLALTLPNLQDREGPRAGAPSPPAQIGRKFRGHYAAARFPPRLIAAKPAAGIFRGRTLLECSFAILLLTVPSEQRCLIFTVSHAQGHRGCPRWVMPVGVRRGWIFQNERPLEDFLMRPIEKRPSDPYKQHSSSLSFAFWGPAEVSELANARSVCAVSFSLFLAQPTSKGIPLGSHMFDWEFI